MDKNDQVIEIGLDCKVDGKRVETLTEKMLNFPTEEEFEKMENRANGIE